MECLCVWANEVQHSLQWLSGILQYTLAVTYMHCSLMVGLKYFVLSSIIIAKQR